ncbi:MAG: hypothetical protein ACQEXJ_10245 [Myxococcota bacterium]
MQMHPKQLEALKRMTPARKLELAAQLREEAWALKAAALRARYPEWPEERVHDEVRELFLHART